MQRYLVPTLIGFLVMLLGFYLALMTPAFPFLLEKEFVGWLGVGLAYVGMASTIWFFAISTPLGRRILRW